MQKLECYLFYFDIVGVVERYLNKEPVFETLLEWQRAVRGDIPDWIKINCKTFADNVLARFNVDGRSRIDYEVLQYAGKTMNDAKRFGFNRFFGVITKGLHEYELYDRTFTSSGDMTDISVQHLDTFSDPYLRAVMAEKWSSQMAKAGIHPGENAVWVSEEVFNDGLFHGPAYSQELQFRDLGILFDLNDSKFKPMKKWPFPKGKFRLIGPKLEKLS